MNEKRPSPTEPTHVDCRIKGKPAGVLKELIKKGIAQNNCDAVTKGILALKEANGKLGIQNFSTNLADVKIYLRPWEEVIGNLHEVKITDDEIIASLSCIYEKRVTVAISKNIRESEQIQKQLEKHIGDKIAILETDNPKRPPLIRTVNENKPNQEPVQSSANCKTETVDA